jgi:hypothetical protein
MKKIIQKITMSTLIFAASSFTLAQAAGIYIGGGIYQSYAEQEDFDEEDTVPAVFVGYNFLDSNIFMLSGELGYYDLGSYSGTTNNINYDIDASAFTLAGVGYIPIGPFFEIYAKAGVAAMSIDIERNSEKYDDDGGKAFGGLGFSFDILDTIDIYAEYLVFDTTIDSSIVGLGVRLAF